MSLRCAAGGKVGRRGSGSWQETIARPGTLWLCPIGIHEDSIRMTSDIPEVFHLYLSRNHFDTFSREEWDRPFSPEAIHYLAGVEDDLIRQLCNSILNELREETSGGKLLVETMSLALCAHLAHSYSGQPRKRAATGTKPDGLDGARLQRVLDYVRDNPDGDLSVADLASVACLSRYHFARAFQKAVGLPPHRYVSEQRLVLARRLLAESSEPLAQVALTCRFSSQANFTRAFQRAAGISPGQYRLAAQPLSGVRDS